MEVRLRAAVDADSQGVIALIGSVYTEYPGCVLDVDREEPALRSPASSFDRFWVLERDGAVVGSIGLTALGPDTVEMKKLYLDRNFRGLGHGAALLDEFEDCARTMGTRRIELWSDTRFAAAHRFYERHGYVRTGRTRELDDLSQTIEYHYLKSC